MRTTTAAKAAKPRAAKPAAPSSNVVPFPADARERARVRRRCQGRLRDDVFARAAEKGWKFVPPAAADLMQYQLLLNDASRDALLTLAKALYANKANHWFQ